MQDLFCRPVFRSDDRLFRNSVPLPQNHLVAVALRSYVEEQCRLEVDLPTPRIKPGTLRRRKDQLRHRFDEMRAGQPEVMPAPMYFWPSVHGRRYLFPAIGGFPEKGCDHPKNKTGQ